MQAPDALTLCQWISGSKGLVANQSFCFSLAEGLKSPRVLEVFEPVPNVIPHGPNAACCLEQGLFEAHVADLLSGSFQNKKRI